jgi:hypothetical protein
MRLLLSFALGLLTAGAALAGGHGHKASAEPTLRPFPADAPRWNAERPLTWGQFHGKVVWLDFWNHR